VFSFGRDSALRLASIKCDKRGNILTRKHYDYSTSDPLLLLDTVTYSYNGTWKDKLVSYNGASITYDSLGNPLTYGSGTFTWDKGRQLSVVNTGTKSISYKYNAEGLRTRKTEGNVTTEYTWVSGLLMSMTDGTNTLQFSYSPEGEALSVKYNGTDYYYIRNLQGDVTGIYNYVGSVVVKYAYDAWGKIISVTGSMANTLGKLNPFRYRSYIYDEETGFYYLQSRYYDPEIGRFINADIFVSTGTGLNGFNMFAYCGNNPVMYVDVTGTMHVKGTDGVGISSVITVDITEKLDKAMRENAAILREYNDVHNYVNTVAYFVDKVKPEGDWDFKAQEDWALDPYTIYVYNDTRLRYDDIGNIHYGYVGRVIFSSNMLLLAGGVVQIYAGTSDWSYWKTNFDDPRDQWAIQFGCHLWDKGALL